MHDRQAGGGYQGRLSCKAAAAIGSLLRDLIRAGGSSRQATRACPAERRRGDLLLAASPRQEDRCPAMCISMWVTCAKRPQACARAVEMLGIPPPGRADKKAFNWENTIPRPVHAEEIGIVHMPRRESS